MLIQFHSDNHIAADDQLTGRYQELIERAMKRFGDRVSRIIVSFADENGQKDGQFDKRCMMEARLDGLAPVAVSAHAETLDQAVRDAIEKLKSAAGSVVEKQRAQRTKSPDENAA